MLDTTRQSIYLRFGALLDYPGPDLTRQARECTALLAPIEPAAASHLEGFLAFVEHTSPGRLEEIYTGTFDVNPACYIFAGYLLFGESFKRGKFLVQLQEKYREHGFSAGNELADHLAVMFRFLATLGPDDVLAHELVEDCLIPVLRTMSAGLTHDSENPNPYTYVLRAILTTLESVTHAVPVA
jgi:nitrate reductase delta subunit